MADKKKILIADDFQLLREDLTELINNQRDMEVVGTASRLLSEPNIIFPTPSHFQVQFPARYSVTGTNKR